MRLAGLLLLITVVALTLGFVGCSGREGPPQFEGPPVRVVCTTTIVADVVRRIGGDRVQFETLMAAGVDPHKYISGAGDRKKLDDAHLVFLSGLHLEGKMAELFEKNHERWRAHAITDSIDRAQLLHADVDGGEHDPHVWFDVRLWSQTIPTVQKALSELDPAGAATYERNADQYKKELDALDGEVRAALEAIPTNRRVLVTSHDAFGYFGRAYGFEVIGLQGVSTASEVGTPQRDKLATLIGERRIPAVFTETSVPPVGLKGVLDDVYAKKKYKVNLIGGDDALYSDALGPPGSPGETYAGMIRHNVKVIVEALKP
jgi:manganese/zinc/iron transport system substrate-binding protein